METEQPFRIELDRQERACIARLVGALGMEACDDLQARLVELAGEPGLTLVLDLSALEFISSMGLGAIVAAHLRTRHTGGNVRLAAAPVRIRELLDMTRLSALLPTYDTLDAALAG